MKLSIAAAALIALSVAPALAFDMSGVATDTMRDLTGPKDGQKIANKVKAGQPLHAKGIASLTGRSLRTRCFEIGWPDGIASLHGHEDRPAIFTIAASEIYEFSSLSEGPFCKRRVCLPSGADRTSRVARLSGGKTAGPKPPFCTLVLSNRFREMKVLRVLGSWPTAVTDVLFRGKCAGPVRPAKGPVRKQAVRLVPGCLSLAQLDHFVPDTSGTRFWCGLRVFPERVLL